MTTDNGEAAWLSTAAGTSWTPPEIDFTKPQTARMYDYYLGGKDHYVPDRETAERVVGVWPSVGKFARANRHFMHLAVERLATAGVEQFLDVGTGIPTSPNVHEIAQAVRPGARILYTDHDPVVLAHARALMNSTEQGRIDYIEGDLRRPETILGHPCMAGPDPALDLTRPVAVNLVAIMHFITPEDDPRRIVGALMDALPAGSHLVLSHITAEFAPAEVDAAARLYHKQGLPAHARGERELTELVDALGLELLPPGILPVNRWSAETSDDPPAPLYSDAEASCLGLIARKA
ncbi:SAM-dependent methyltransferase [Streptomyces phytophilus]|uniref:SAM-dependent methyltransferase n=1 Tax=Streptomyces phytophilus TaxID=722715 RepID=UPI0015F02D22|nr:SAM-dependent methyltransferase [Streptomyces phytophilus]